jgi:hypothetical protein
MDTIKATTEEGQEGHLAIKLTSLFAIDVMTRISRAQEIFTDEILMLYSKPQGFTR